MAEAKKRRPSVFIGSSSEGLDVAKAIQLNLDRACEIVLWSQGVFGLGGGTLESLVNQLTEFDFAILVLSADDMVFKREILTQQPRDNVLLELGLFIGAIGRRRTFIVFDRTAKVSIPSDLAGITAATYEPHTNGNLQPALGACCTQIEGAIGEQGLRSQPKLNFDVDQSTHFQVIADLLDRSVIQFIILMYDQHLALQREGMFSPGFRYEYQSNRGAGAGGFSVNEMCAKLPDAGLLKQDLRNCVTLTTRGEEFAAWLIAHNMRAEYFSSPVGSWGQRSEAFPMGLNPVPMSAPEAKGDEGPKRKKSTKSK